MTYLSRISARVGEVVGLNTTFYNNGVPTNPHRLHSVEIYKCSYNSHNLVAVIPISDNTLYPAPAEEVFTESADPCNPTSSLITRNVGSYVLPWLVPSDFQSPSVYLDVWKYWGSDPCDDEDECDYDDSAVLSKLLSCCSKFWVYPSSWFCDDGTCDVNFAFIQHVRFVNKPDVRNITTHISQLPLYSCNSRLFDLFPFCTATYSIGTQNCELLVDSQPAEIVAVPNSGFPFGVRFRLDSSTMLRGSYWYTVTVSLPDGTSRTSEKFFLAIK